MVEIQGLQGYNESERSGQNLTIETDLNYQAAQSYFVQKKMAFLKAMCNKANVEIEQVENALVSSMNSLITDKWNKINNSVLQQNVIVNNSRSGSYTIKENAQWKNIPDWLRKRIIENSKNGNIFSILGFAYEDWLETHLKQAASKVEDANINKLISDMLKQFKKTGSLKSNSSIRGDNLDIRPDLAIGIDKRTVADVNNKDLKAELQTTFDIENYRKDHGLLTPEAIQNDTNMLRSYIDSNMFGLSVKRWTSSKSEPRVLTSASGMQQMVNKTYEQSGDHTWNALYAYRTMVHILSKFLLDILGPVNVAFITGTEFEWTSDFLSDALLTMNIYSPIMTDKYEILPKIQSGHIYVQHFKRGRKLALMQQQLSKATKQEMHGKGWDAYQLRFKIKD